MQKYEFLITAFELLFNFSHYLKNKKVIINIWILFV